MLCYVFLFLAIFSPNSVKQTETLVSTKMGLVRAIELLVCRLYLTFSSVALKFATTNLP